MAVGAMAEIHRYPIELLHHEPEWARTAEREAGRLREALGPALVAVHHIGSTAVPGLRAKPIVDLLPVARSLAEVDAKRSALEALGYLWRGEDGIPGRRYCVLFAATPGRRVAQLHVYEADADDVARHLRFRDYLRAHAGEARAYEAVKLRAQVLHPQDVLAYNDAKAGWIRGCLERAAAWDGSARHG
jgi:GrpB-like predicted nucleotidyltransferase (UPF0157 family)